MRQALAWAVLVSVLSGCAAPVVVGQDRTNFGQRDGSTRSKLLGPGDGVQAGGDGGSSGSSGD